jgi:hypothetical protein
MTLKNFLKKLQLNRKQYVMASINLYHQFQNNNYSFHLYHRNQATIVLDKNQDPKYKNTQKPRKKYKIWIAGQSKEKQTPSLPDRKKKILELSNSIFTSQT